ncbi:hypothetical protein [Rosistilla carotiformis]|uniref:hypothetical protein n=1 Tax=Rosistilla carotiformis TaxID=2528017 RepID=UPI00119E73AB|nr:hypothetical protein [Rosistilla carotiformis]
MDRIAGIDERATGRRPIVLADKALIELGDNSRWQLTATRENVAAGTFMSIGTSAGDGDAFVRLLDDLDFFAHLFVSVCKRDRSNKATRVFGSFIAAMELAKEKNSELTRRFHLDWVRVECGLHLDEPMASAHPKGMNRA